MFRKLIQAALLLVALSAIGPSAASAAWFDKGVQLKAGENPTIETTGTFAFTSSGGGVHCNTATSKMQFTGGTNTGHVLTFGVEEPSKCEVSGGLVLLTGGTTTLKSTTITKTESGWALTLVVLGIGVCNWEEHLEFKNGFKLTLTSVEGSPVNLTPNNTTSMSSFSLAGELNSTLAAGKVAVSGTMNVLAPNAGTYGIVS